MRAEGTVADGFEPVRDAFAEAQSHDEGGAQLCVYRNGKRVVDIWAGTDKLKNRPYTADTITILMSCTKAVAAICVHMLAQRGLIDYDAPRRALLAGVRGQGQGVDHGARHPGASRGPDGLRRGKRNRLRARVVRLGSLHGGAGEHGAMVEAGHGVLLSRADLRLPGRRDRSARLGI